MYTTNECVDSLIDDIAFITCNSNLVPLLEGLCSSNEYET